MRATYMVICIFGVACGSAQQSADEPQKNETTISETVNAGESSVDSVSNKTNTESEASKSDDKEDRIVETQKYSKEVTQIFHEQWQTPTLIPEEELMALHASILIRVDENMVIVSIELVDPSGNDDFDTAIEKTIDSVRKNREKLPNPPESLKSIITNGGIKIHMHGRNDSQGL